MGVATPRTVCGCRQSKDCVHGRVRIQHRRQLLATLAARNGKSCVDASMSVADEIIRNA